MTFHQHLPLAGRQVEALDLVEFLVAPVEGVGVVVDVETVGVGDVSTDQHLALRPV